MHECPGGHSQVGRPTGGFFCIVAGSFTCISGERCLVLLVPSLQEMALCPMSNLQSVQVLGNVKVARG